MKAPYKGWSVYILLCSDESLYTGVAVFISRRLRQHAQGRASKYTRSRLPVKLVYLTSGLTKSEALKEEARIKSLPAEEKWSMVESYHDIHKNGHFCLNPTTPYAPRAKRGA